MNQGFTTEASSQCPLWVESRRSKAVAFALVIAKMRMMSFAESVWTVIPLGAALTVLLLFMRKRRTTIDYAESKAVKARLPAWVKIAELLIAVACGWLLATGAGKLYFFLLGSSVSPDSLAGAPAALVVLGIGAIIVPLAFLAANAVSGIIPALREANETAFRGNHVSSKTANLGLIKFASVSIPLGLLALGIAAVQPWVENGR